MQHGATGFPDSFMTPEASNFLHAQLLSQQRQSQQTNPAANSLSGAQGQQPGGLQTQQQLQHTKLQMLQLAQGGDPSQQAQLLQQQH